MKIYGTAKGLLVCFLLSGTLLSGSEIDFNRDIRSILSNHCLTCHGPDPAERKADLRLDTQAGSRADLGGYAAILPGDPDASELLKRVVTSDEDDRMPPPEIGPPLSEDQIASLRQWIAGGADYAVHWAYVPPIRAKVPPVARQEWVRNPIDRFVLAHLEREGLEPSEEADRWALARRAAIDLTGLPPRSEEVEAFLEDRSDLAFERYVDGLLHADAFGERWARVWLDLARYADSAGYADDPPRTIWAYRDYVIRSLNENLPFDQFTVEQLAGDLLPNPTEEQLIATAFHRNTMTNSEGGTDDEQFRNEAIVDRVNTTMQVWMGTTIACAQCHNHKYDPITQKEYFEFFAFFNNTEDSDRRNEEPLLSLYSNDQKKQQARWKEEIASLQYQLRRPDDRVTVEQQHWEARLAEVPEWTETLPSEGTAEHRRLEVGKDGVIRAKGAKSATDSYQVLIPLENEPVTAIRLETLAQQDGFAVTQVSARWRPAVQESVTARFVRVEIPGKRKILSLAELEVMSGGINIAPQGKASQSSTASGGLASRGNDGNTNGNYSEANSTTHTATSDNPWWELDLGKATRIDELRLWNRTDGGDGISGRLKGFQIKLLAADRSKVWEKRPSEVPNPNLSLGPGGERSLNIVNARADFQDRRRLARNVLQPRLDPKKYWSVGQAVDKAHELVLALDSPLPSKAGTLLLTVGQESESEKQLIDAFAVSVTSSIQVGEFLQTPENITDLVGVAAENRDAAQKAELAAYFRTVSPTLKPLRDQLADREKKLREFKPMTTVPVLRQLAANKRRKTNIQIRGNYLNKEEEVNEGTPEAFHALPEGVPRDRLALAQWLVSRDNPLTARVISNRHWEQLFGRGIVSTSEEFGSQGDLPTHPALLDWLAVELMDSGWDLKHLLKLMVTSSTYRQSSRVTDDDLERDPDNQWYARGPRFRISAEMIRDQALEIGGLLSRKKYGPPARPFQPKLGVSAAFGSGIDWEPSEGADRYRRGLYTNWRRSNPYPSMTTFDAPTREVCTVRRPRSNTPLQALVTLNDPVYIEAAQGLARRIMARAGTVESKVEWAFQSALVRPASASERDRLVGLFRSTKEFFDVNLEQANEMATVPYGKIDKGTDVSAAASWTVVGNVLLNLDEIFLKR